MTELAIYYKTKTPIIYNKGTEFEASCDEFLAYYTHKSLEDAQKVCDAINATHPKAFPNGVLVDWNKVAYVFVEEPY